MIQFAAAFISRTRRSILFKTSSSLGSGDDKAGRSGIVTPSAR